MADTISQNWETYVSNDKPYATEDDVDAADKFLDHEICRLIAIGVLLDRIKTVCGGNCNTEDAARTLACMIVNAEMTEDDFLAHVDEITDDEILQCYDA